ncbi:MAG: hypothetical protein IJS39_10840 [Synergistaceae bacterium]|nr:hypothetical protein [Synergistaceae bacterium]
MKRRKRIYVGREDWAYTTHHRRICSTSNREDVRLGHKPRSSLAGH